MEELKIIYLPLDALTPYENNARKHEKADLQTIENSIKQFGMCDPIGIWSDKNIIVEGHGRLLALKDLGYTEAPCIRLDHLTDEQRKAYALAHNKTAEMSEWDLDKLSEELEGIALDMERFGFELKESDEENPYTTKVEIPAYQPMEDEAPPIEFLYDDKKTVELQKEIDEAEIPDEVKAFLKLAAYRHTVFDYGQIAEYYCHAPAEIQDLMEKSALVIIDFNKAIEYGYTNLKDELNEMLEQDKVSGDE